MKQKTLLLAGMLLCITSVTKAQFISGDGSVFSPFEISTTAQLDAVRDNLTSYFILMNDLDLSNDFPTWTSIGKDPNGTPANFKPFSGSFDGQGHVISGLNISYTGEYSGLFAVVSGKVHNLGVKGKIDNPSGGGCGLVAGYLGQTDAPGEIKNCFAEGSVKTSGVTKNSAVGLLVGNQTRGSVVLDCYAKGSVVAENGEFVGGLVGRMQQNYCITTNCFAEVDVIGTTYVGGLCGRFYSNKNRNFGFLYATGSVTGVDWVGGIAGDIYAGNNGGPVIAANSTVQALSASGNVNRVGPIGQNKGVETTIILDSVYGLSTTEVLKAGIPVTINSNINGPDGLTKSLSELQDPTFYDTWDMDKWAMPSTPGFPILKSMTTNIENVKNKKDFFAFTLNKMLHIRNIAPESKIAVYNANGQLIRQQVSTSTTDVVILPQSGWYVVKVQSGKNKYSEKVLCN